MKKQIFWEIKRIIGTTAVWISLLAYTLFNLLLLGLTCLQVTVESLIIMPHIIAISSFLIFAIVGLPLIIFYNIRADKKRGLISWKKHNYFLVKAIAFSLLLVPFSLALYGINILLIFIAQSKIASFYLSWEINQMYWYTMLINVSVIILLIIVVISLLLTIYCVKGKKIWSKSFLILSLVIYLSIGIISITVNFSDKYEVLGLIFIGLLTLTLPLLIIYNLPRRITT